MNDRQNNISFKFKKNTKKCGRKTGLALSLLQQTCAA